MIVNYNKKKHLYGIMSFISKNRDKDFYYTEDNLRKYITSVEILEKFLKDTVKCLVYPEDGDIKGLVLVWRAVGGDKNRYYVKISALNKRIADKLMIVLLWNFSSELFVKISRNSPHLSIFQKKGFKFAGGRGREILLKLEKRKIENGNSTVKSEG